MNTVKGSAYAAYNRTVWAIPLAPFKAFMKIMQSTGVAMA